MAARRRGLTPPCCWDGCCGVDDDGVEADCRGLGVEAPVRTGVVIPEGREELKMVLFWGGCAM